MIFSRPLAHRLEVSRVTEKWFGFPLSDWDETKEMARGILQARAARPSPTISYSELGTQLRPIAFEPDSKAFHQMLGEISSEEDDAGRGMLSVLVVHKDGDMRPGPGFFSLAADRGELPRALGEGKEAFRRLDVLSRRDAAASGRRRRRRNR